MAHAIATGKNCSCRVKIVLVTLQSTTGSSPAARDQAGALGTAPTDRGMANFNASQCEITRLGTLCTIASCRLYFNTVFLGYCDNGYCEEIFFVTVFVNHRGPKW